MASSEHPNKRSIVFIDGQNLFYAVKQAFGYNYPNCDAMARWVCQRQSWQLTESYFYIGLERDSYSGPYTLALNDSLIL